jgi:phosphopantetheine--protein transferase-like protein
MIRGIGVDIVQIARFDRWKQFSSEQLSKIFSVQEIKDCRSDDTLLVDKLAVRFTAKEAFYKALSTVCVSYGLTQTTATLRSLCPYIEVRYGTWQIPVLHIAWKEIEQHLGLIFPPLNVHLTYSHERDMAVAFVVIEEMSCSAKK